MKSPFEVNKKSQIVTSPARFNEYVNNGTANLALSYKQNSLNQRSLSRTLLRSTGKHALSNAQSHQSSQLDVRTAFNHTMENIETKKSPFGMKSKEYGVIRLDELEGLRMRASGYDEKTLDHMQATQNKLELQAISRSRVGNWNNTSEGNHIRRQQETLKRLEEEELRRRELDAVEFDLQQQARTQLLNKALKQSYVQQDQVKAFHSKLLLSDVMHEREFQKRVQEKKKLAASEVERQWENHEKAVAEAYDEKLKEKLKNEYDLKMHHQKDIKQQLHNHKLNLIQSYKESMMEGGLIAKAAEDEMIANRQKELKKRRKELENAQTMKLQEMELKVFQAQSEEKQQEEEARIEERNQKMLEQQQRIKDVMDQKQRERNDRISKLYQTQDQQLRVKLMDTKEDRILNKQVEEAEAKSIKIWHEQLIRRENLKQQVDVSRKNLIQKRRHDHLMEKSQEREFADYMKLRNQELDMHEANERADQRGRAEQMSNFMLHQVEIKKQKAEQEFKDEIAERDRTLANLDENDKQFYSYAERAIKDWADAGKNIKPLIVELKNYKKKVL